jgi:phosphodiesterase/alkaline phosphatase D-like protein/2',3'-cyclic-nucleotide 2'-phosphodiesterase (5'-nucleotidase family)
LTAGGVHAGLASDSISVNDVSIVEGNTGTSTLAFTVSRVGNAAAFSLNWATADSTASAPGDYTAANGTLNFTAGGSLTETVSVTIVGDATGEANETFFLNLSNLVLSSGSASLSDDQGIGTITDNDAVAPAITTQPANAFVVAGSTRALSVVATGTPAPSFQWYRGATGVITAPVGTNSASFTTPGLSATTPYWVRVTNLKGTIDSSTATLTVPEGSNALLSALTTAPGTLSPVFAGPTLTYSASVSNATTAVAVTPTVAIGGATLTASVNGGAFNPATSGSPIPITLNPGNNTLSVKVTAIDLSTTRTYNISLVRLPVFYTSGARDVLEPNRGPWPTSGVSLGTTQFINLGLQGVGRVSASSKDTTASATGPTSNTGESIGSISDMQITSFANNGDGTFTGTLQTLPDRGYNATVTPPLPAPPVNIFSNYAARLNTFNFTFTPYTGAGPAPQNQIALSFAGSTRFTYDHDGLPGTSPVFSTGLLANGPATTLFGTVVPVAAGDTTQSDGTVTNRLTLDTEGIIFDTRPGKDGTGWVSDEYGAFIYHFNAAKQLDGQLQLPAALIPHSPVGTRNFAADPPLNGRRINQGMEGIAQSPDGTRLYALLQSATIQDSGAGNPGRFTTRLLVYDISSSDMPSDPVAQYVIQLPRADDTGAAANGSTVNRNLAESAMVALNNNQLLILSRDGSGRGVDASNPPVFKSILLADLTGATNIDGLFDAEGNAVAPGGVLNAAVAPISWTEAVNMLGKLNAPTAEVEKFGLNLNGGHGDANTLSEKWEGLALVPVSDPANPNDYFLFVANDNDFLTTNGAYMDAAGNLQTYDGGVENDTVVLAYRVRIAAVTAAPTVVSSGDVTQTSAVLWANSKFVGNVKFEYSTSPTFASGVSTAVATTTDPTAPVKVSVGGLAANTVYHYRVTTTGDMTTGKFKTNAGASTIAGLKFGVSGDQRGELAPFPSIKNAAAKDLNFFLQLGDNIYGDVATPDLPTVQARTLSDYRIRHNEIYSPRYGMNTFADLRKSTSILGTIDDHEVINDFSGADLRVNDARFAADTGTLISDTETFLNGIQAFREFMPMNLAQYGATGDPVTAYRAKLYRYSTYGRDAAVFMLDGRSFRSAPLPSVTNPTDPVQINNFLAGAFTPGRTMIGAQQKADFKADLIRAQSAGIVWKFVFCPEPVQNFGPFGGSDRYEGYAAERTELLKFIDDNKINNVVFVAADFHGTAINRLSYQTGPGQPQIQTNSIEILTGSVAYDKPFGPTIIELAAGLGVVDPATQAAYNALPNGATKEGIVAAVINGTTSALGYNPLSPTAEPLPGTTNLLNGLYMATNTYGWTEFTIDPVTQKLNLKTWGIEPYNKAQLDADPVAVTGRTPAVMSEFEMTPQALTINSAALAGFSMPAHGSPLNLTTAAGVSPAGGIFSGPGIMGDTFDPALAPAGLNVVTYAFGAQSVTFNVTVAAAPSLSANPSHAFTSLLKSSIVLSDNGTSAGIGGAEIPAFDPVTDLAFTASGAGIQVVNLANPSAPVRLAPIDPMAAPYNLPSRDISHVIVKNGVLAVSIVSVPNINPGTVAFFDPATRALLGSVTVGAVPDQLVFTPDGTKVLVANEGEKELFSTNPGSINPEGSVSIINVSGGFAAPSVQTATFAAWNGQEDLLRSRGIRVFPGNSATVDLEPEYVAVSPDGLTAMVTLQEANAIAVLDIPTATFTAINPLGLKNFANGQADYSDRDSSANAQLIKLIPAMPTYGMFMPDAISSYQSDGQTYYVTANEGDDRNDFTASADAETTSVNATNYDLDNTVFPTEGVAATTTPVTAGTGLKGNAQLGRLTVSNVPGLRGDLDGDGDVDRILSYGGRSFSILDATGKRIFDSGDVVDRILTTHFPSLYDDGRSDNKSAEPEGVTVSVIGGKAYAFIGLERAQSVIVFDVTDPANVTFTTLATRSGDLNPEGMMVIPAADSPTGIPLLLVASEVSYTLTTFELVPQSPALQLQILHYYGESGLLGLQTAPLMGAMIDRFDDQYPNTVVIGEGDSFIPGPWLIGGADPSLNRVLHTGTFTSAADSTATPMAQADIAIMNAFGTTVSALGNHEFDLGSPVLKDAIAPANSATLGNWAGALFPIITANLDFGPDSSLRALADSTIGGTTGSPPNNYRGAETTAIRSKIAPYAIRTIDGQRVGFVGATTWNLLTKSSPNGTRPKDDANAATSDLQEVAAYVQNAVDSLKVIGVNKIIMVDQLDELQRNKDLAPLLTGVDVMVAGGGHERMGDATDTAVAFNGHDADFIADTYPIVTAGADGKPTLIVTTDTEYSYLGRLVVDFDANGELLLGTLNPALNGAYAATPAIVEAVFNNGQTAAQIVTASPMATRVKAITDAINTVVQTKDGLVYGYTKVYMEGDRVFGRTQEVNLGDITADANAAKAKAALGLSSANAVFSLKNGGGLRASLGSVASDGSKIPPLANPLTGKPAGAITRLDVENALRFDNKLVVFDTTPTGLLALLNFTAGLSSGPTAQNGGYPQVGNIRFSYEFSRPAGQRVRSAVLIDDNGTIVSKIVENGAVLPGAQAVIPVVALNFTANGGDGYPIKYLDPTATPPNQIVNPETSNFRFVLNDGTLSTPVARNLDFTAAAVVPATSLGEQKAFSDYLTVRHNTPAKAYDVADTVVALDTRIQQIPARTDTVPFSPVEIWRLANFGNTSGSGANQGTLDDADSDSANNLFEFAFGTDPTSNLTGSAELIYTGTFAGGGSLTLPGQPLTQFEAIPNSVDFRALFVRRKDYVSAGLTYIPQFSTDLSSWHDSTVIPTVLADNGTYQVVSAPYPRFIAGRKARFFRILVNLAP